MQCNIDARGKAVRLIWGLVMLTAAMVVATILLLGALASAWWWVAVFVFVVFGGLGIYEARAGWCVVRAMGFKTRV